MNTGALGWTKLLPTRFYRSTTAHTCRPPPPREAQVGSHNVQNSNGFPRCSSPKPPLGGAERIEFTEQGAWKEPRGVVHTCSHDHTNTHTCLCAHTHYANTHSQWEINNANAYGTIWDALSLNRVSDLTNRTHTKLLYLPCEYTTYKGLSDLRLW